MNVRSILEQKGREVFTLHPGITLGEAAGELARRRIGAVLLTTESGAIAGILSERDIVRAVGIQGISALEEPVEGIMTKKVTTCDESAGIDEIMGIMTRGRFRHLPVVEGGRLVGIVSIGDVVKRRIEEVVREAEDMRTYIAAAG
ncbi:inosine-5-monophosphate dehydrogenase [Aureimonas endophytica]|uniref:Inosine-5-monophosphate dehydrogenase n=1 Tax=Aureimonas endophytica TaxID=2027858 RepID=A0A917E1S1_9HYPH|nr:CBS domain-containing protein [Aureimonas endophytica]GGD90487.1 inosine-5-monophosphate dehydrogenase [Aureimonas endophytica]